MFNHNHGSQSLSSLSATQNSAQVTSVTTTDGTVVISATVTDNNQQGTHNFVWNVTGVINFTANSYQMSFDTSALNVAQVVISAQANDNGSPSLSASTNLTLTLTQSVPVEPEISIGGTLCMYMVFGLILIALRRNYLQ